jgi:hypothetical protein
MTREESLRATLIRTAALLVAPLLDVPPEVLTVTITAGDVAVRVKSRPGELPSGDSLSHVHLTPLQRRILALASAAEARPAKWFAARLGRVCDSYLRGLLGKLVDAGLLRKDRHGGFRLPVTETPS